MKTEKNSDEYEETKDFPRLNRFLKKIEKFYEGFIEPNDLEEVFAVFLIIAIVIIIAIIIIFFLPIVIKLISFWWNLIL